MTQEQMIKKINDLENSNAELQRQVRDMNNALMEITKFNTPTRFYFKDVIFFEQGCKMGFFGKDPVAQQSLASDTLANLLTALRTYGIIKT